MTTPGKLAFGLAFVLSALLSGCHAGDASSHPASSTETMGLGVVGYNHTDHDIGDFSVNGEAGSYVGKHEEHGVACCVSLPAKHTPGLTVTVTWTDEDNKHPQSRVVAVPPYTPADGGEFHVHFLRNGNIKVFATAIVFLGNPDYPLKGDEARM
ncbi:DUF3304 domain-containing protein [Paraburkholderia sp. CNPSo 3272]|uniref:DUF3304 domain-containing protein n=1 Tax=Paraburkholderia sp. CNPSo 3272 TaxID=2940931 RepID=UPI0020B83ABF|nr:DUF3304 domain-containing protein [Paraburkholderia sp. CNPSo 3272]MCP3723752.1 DUF3304 domain-containing protein [Paraburkholderia sp. CNPSo 3272]